MTPKQLEAIQAVSRGEVVENNHGHGAWRVAGANPASIGGLVRKGWVRWAGWPRKAELTDAGRNALAETEGRA